MSPIQKQKQKTKKNKNKNKKKTKNKNQNKTKTKIPREEAEDSSLKSLTDHEGSKRFFPSGSHIYTTPQQVSYPQASHKRQKIPPHAHLLLSKFSPSPMGPTIKTTCAHILLE